jgi:hypothetical protein
MAGDDFFNEQLGHSAPALMTAASSMALTKKRRQPVNKQIQQARSKEDKRAQRDEAREELYMTTWKVYTDMKCAPLFCHDFGHFSTQLDGMFGNARTPRFSWLVIQVGGLMALNERQLYASADMRVDFANSANDAAAVLPADLDEDLTGESVLMKGGVLCHIVDMVRKAIGVTRRPSTYYVYTHKNRFRVAAHHLEVGAHVFTMILYLKET